MSGDRPSAFEHLIACGDPVMEELVVGLGELDEAKRRRGRPKEAYGALVRSITGQQLSVKAAATIYGRVTDLYGGRTPSPEELIETDPEMLRAAGLSYAKASYLRSLAEHVVSGELELDRIARLSDDEVVAQLTAVKGLGTWTAHMFMMFHLRRPDVLPVGDLGIRNAAKQLYRMRKLPDPQRLERIARPWAPHRTVACIYLWESLDNAPA